MGNLLLILPALHSTAFLKWLDWVDNAFDRKVKAGSKDGITLEVALLLIKDYEDKHYPVPKPDPIEAVKIKMLEKGLKNKDLVGKVGTKGYVSAVLSGKKPLTLELAKLFRRELGVFAEVLLS